VIRNQEKIDQVTELYVAGLSTRQIAERTGISKSVAGNIIKQAAIGRDRSRSQILGCRRSTRVPPDWSFLPLTTGKAWLLGLIYGDGTLSRQGDRVAITSGDRDVIDNINALFGNALAFDVTASTYWSIRIHSKRLWLELYAHFGLTPNKSRTLPYPSLEGAMKPHFVRGLLDSDGCWILDARNPQRNLLKFRYVSLALPFITSLRSDLIQYVGVSSRRKVCKGSGYIIDYSNKDAIAIGRWLYADSTAETRCIRKFAIWSQFAS
jgi:hypothetical protein